MANKESSDGTMTMQQPSMMTNETRSFKGSLAIRDDQEIKAKIRDNKMKQKKFKTKLNDYYRRLIQLNSKMIKIKKQR